ncbi:MAG: LysM peptidoglycan-binding domain-containing protein [Anaerolineales bacterium]|nr:LysM peptidoglycan-binding domain-containing protein [Anaerolineales bacterium]
MFKSPRRLRIVFAGLALLLAILACTRSAVQEVDPWVPGNNAVTSGSNPTSTQIPFASDPRQPGAPILTPTPDDPHPLPGLRTEPEQYVAQPGDTLGAIADRFGISVAEIAEASQISNVNVLSVGQTLTIPVPAPVATGPPFKIIPDSELVAGPVSSYFDVTDFVYSQNGYLVRYEEELNGRLLSGSQIVQLIGRDFSVNPRLLLAILEHQSGWVTQMEPRPETLKYPLGWQDPNRQGLYRQLAWAANELNRGYYLWRTNAVASWVLADGIVVPANPTINAGTAAVQHFFAELFNYSIWTRAVTAEGLSAVYNALFGYPFDYTFEPLLPPDLNQPRLQLPFEPGVQWAFTGGPHGGWGDGSAWGALDFAPHLDQLGCVPSDDWVVAMADGLILRAEDGAVVQDLDSDGREQTGWTILYMHIESRERVQAGIYLRAGERIGHPSCEGGVSDGTHVHIARRYNGEWIPADQDWLPFVMDSWVSSGAGSYYDGYLQKGATILEAWNGWRVESLIER